MPRADPGLYAYSPIVDRPRLTWPQGARLAVWVAPNLEHVLDHVLGRPGVWPATGAEILAAFKAQEG